MLFSIIVGLLLLACTFLVFLVVIQNSKGGGLSSSVAGVSQASQIIGVRRTADLVEKATWWTIGIIMALSFASGFVIEKGGSSKSSLKMGDAISSAPAPTTSKPNLQDLKKDKPTETTGEKK
ncbi:MAG: preprotein translocase subunit SecG [Bacteroidia bacterium]|nr:preprotein translocase subunit SecG [Bacteroidia bacterium]